MAVSALTAFLLVSILTLATRARVEKELSSECQEFLYSRMLPKGFTDKNFHFICQSYDKKARYVTLYNTKDRIPIYSAYIFRHSVGEKCINAPWMYEPQVKNVSLRQYSTVILHFLSYPLSASTAIYTFGHG